VGRLFVVGGYVDQCSFRTFFVRKEREQGGEGENKSFRRGGKGRDSRSTEI